MLLMIFSSCNNHDNPERPTIVNAEYVFQPYIEAVNKMPDDLPADLFPNNAAPNCVIINSAEEIATAIPENVTAMDPYYKDIDFSEYSLVSVRYVVFDKLLDVKYKVYLTSDLIEIIQHSYYEKLPEPSFCYVVSNFVCKKLPEGLPVRLSGLASIVSNAEDTPNAEKAPAAE